MDNVNCGVKIDIEYRFVRNFFFSLVLFEIRCILIVSISFSALPIQHTMKLR